MREIETDILIVGGGTGGVAAAIAVARAGGSCVLTEPTDWLGGQLTSQAVPPDENEWIESFGGTRMYQEFRTRVRDWYRANRSLNDSARDAEHLNPGGGWVSRLCVEPSIAHIVIRAMLDEHVASGRVTLLLEHEPTDAEAVGDRIQCVRLRSKDGDQTVVRSSFVLDATELGDVLALAGVEHAIGAEAQHVHDELHARTDLPAGTDTDPLDQQAFSWCFALTIGEPTDPGPAPEGYAELRDWVPEMTPPWTGPLFSFTVPSHNESGRLHLPLHATEPGRLDWWTYRQIADPSIYEPRAPVPEVSLINWVQMDDWRAPLLGVSPGEQRAALEGSRQLSRCLLHWLRTEAPRHDGDGLGYPELHLRGDELGTTDGFAKAPYIREARRLVARTIVTEAHVGTEQRQRDGRPNMDATKYGSGEPFADSVGIGHYQIDLHPSCAGRNAVYVPAAPFRIPLGSLVPVRVRNLLAAGKCLGVTHVTNGCYRLHAVEWNIGESAGHLASWCLANDTEPHHVGDSGERVRDFQSHLAEHGVRLTWPWEPPL